MYHTYIFHSIPHLSVRLYLSISRDLLFPLSFASTVLKTLQVQGKQNRTRKNEGKDVRTREKQKVNNGQKNKSMRKFSGVFHIKTVLVLFTLYRCVYLFGSYERVKVPQLFLLFLLTSLSLFFRFGKLRRLKQQQTQKHKDKHWTEMKATEREIEKRRLKANIKWCPISDQSPCLCGCG